MVAAGLCEPDNVAQERRRLGVTRRVAVAKDLRTSQTREVQREKSIGRDPSAIDAAETAGQTHAVLGAPAGFSINQRAAEYRPLRA
jgi:hypothetical protein